MTGAVLAKVEQRLAPVEGLFRNGCFVGRITCCCCGAHDEWSAANMPQPEVVKKKLAARGWSIARSGTCPACTAKKENTVTTKPSTQPSPAAVALNKMIRLALDDAYDDDAQRYCSGHADETVAKAVGGGCPAAAVAALRERAYGPVGEPDEITEFRRMMDEVTSEVGKLRSRFDLLCTKNGFKQ